MANGQRPISGSQAPRFGGVAWNQPEMRGKGRFFDQEIIVADFERIVELLLADFLRSFVGGSEGDHETVRTPGELLDAGDRLGDLDRIASGHWHYEDLRLGVCASGEEGQTIAGRSPARGTDASPIVSQRAAASARNIHNDEVRVVAILGVVRV